MAGTRPNAWAAFWQALIRFQSAKLTPGLALRNALGVALPLAAGVATGHAAAGIAIATGALNVSFSDGQEPYRVRGKRMLAASALVGCAVFTGAISGNHAAAATAIAAGWAFGAGMLVSLSQAAGDLGVISLVTVIVYSGTPQSLEHAIYSGLLAAAGGIFQTVLALAFWPVRPYLPESRSLGALFTELGRVATEAPEATQSPPATAQSTEAHAAISHLAGNHSIESERMRLLLSQAERIRLSLLIISRLRARTARELGDGPELDAVARYLEACSGMLRSIGRALLENVPQPETDTATELQGSSDRLRAAPPPRSQAAAATLRDLLHQLDALSGQLRSAMDLAASATPQGTEAFRRRESHRPWRLRLGGAAVTLRANLSLRSGAFRHALRLAVCVAIGYSVARGFHLSRAYWLPMTIVIVLKPDFTSTFSRGALRLAGTFAGLLLATVLAHLFTPTLAAHVILIGILMFLVRWLGPANYGVFSIAITSLVVFLFALAGIPANDVIVNRAVNTVAGGAIAIAAYAAWPTWERTQLPEIIARLLDAYRDYFRAIAARYRRSTPAPSLDRARFGARLARSNLEASVDRLLAEPGATPELASVLSGLLASSHRLVHAIMALEAGLATTNPVPPRPGFAPFANTVELTLYYLAAALRDSPLAAADLPDVRAAHQGLVHSGDTTSDRYAIVNVETDRITNSLNTLAEQVFAYRAASG